MRFDLDRDAQIPETLYLIQLVLEACVEAGASRWICAGGGVVGASQRNVGCRVDVALVVPEPGPAASFEPLGVAGLDLHACSHESMRCLVQARPSSKYSLSTAGCHRFYQSLPCSRSRRRTGAVPVPS